MPKTNLNINLNRKLVYKFVKFLTKISNKIPKFKTYNKIIHNLIYSNK